LWSFQQGAAVIVVAAATTGHQQDGNRDNGERV
jgi:hypothetical protein